MLPKSEGGLGIPDIFISNKANMAKHLWDLAHKKDSLWVGDMVSHVYDKRSVYVGM